MLKQGVIGLFLGWLSVTTAIAEESDIAFQGEFIQGAMIRASVPKGSRVLLNGGPVKVSDDGKLVFGFGRDAELSQLLAVHFPDNTTKIYKLTLQKQDYAIQNIKGISKAIMEPSAEDIQRAIKDASETRAARNIDSNLTGFEQNFIWPLHGIITGVYGSQRIYNGVPKRPHFGIDIASPKGTKVKAPADGVVSLAVPDMFFSGGTMIIDHGFGVSSSFLHLSKLLVPVGTKVKQGDFVAEVGSTGRSTGPHLDWRINWFQTRLDPATVVPPMS